MGTLLWGAQAGAGEKGQEPGKGEWAVAQVNQYALGRA